MMKEILPSKGKVFVAGREIGRLRKSQVSKYRRSIGVVFQDFRLLKDRNVYDNVAFAQRVVEAPERVIKRQVPKMLSLVGLLDKTKSFPSELSGGQQQRVALARALVNNPVILLADEPTGNLDPETAKGIMDILNDINIKGTTIVMATHDAGIVNRASHRVLELSNGELIRDERQGGYRLGLI